MSIALERCYHHASREAAARCPECARYFCRECISEHDGRVICAQCLKKAGDPRVARRRFAVFMQVTAVFIGGFLLWSSFYLLGKALLTVPSSFHDPAKQQANSVRR